MTDLQVQAESGTSSNHAAVRPIHGDAASPAAPRSEVPNAADAGEAGAVRPASKYKPRLRQLPTNADIPRKLSAPPAPRDAGNLGSLDADFLLTFQPGNWGISLSLLLRRPEGLPEEVIVQLAGETVDLFAIDEALYEPVPLDEVTSALGKGIAVESVDEPKRRWVRTGRSLHAFSGRAGVAGFASVPRVLIGQENSILCETTIADAVLASCVATGADPPLEVSGPGIPDGWRCFRDFYPKSPSPDQDVDEILLALSPLPDAAIELTGGISISRSSWIAGSPPAIHIIGAEPTASEVAIDGRPAELVDRDRWTAEDWDRPGQHTVRYAGLSRSYEIIEPEESWPGWQAHPGHQLSVCGALATGPGGQLATVLPGPTCWLLGARPGQVALAAPSVAGPAIASPPFEPVWAIPLQSARRRTRLRLLACASEPQPLDGNATADAARQWCRLIRDAVPRYIATPETAALFRLYRSAARNLRRRL